MHYAFMALLVVIVVALDYRDSGISGAKRKKPSAFSVALQQRPLHDFNRSLGFRVLGRGFREKHMTSAKSIANRTLEANF